MKKKILLIPLDERPCNYVFPKLLAKDTDYELVLPDYAILGQKKQVGQIDEIWNFLFDNIHDVTGVIISFDTLMYSGIVPSRLHHYALEDMLKRLHQIEKLKEINPNLIVYGFNLIMRNPTYSSSDEEPDYYADYGREIHLRGVYEHKKSLNIITESEEADYQDILSRLPETFYNDYIDRRQKNLEINKKVIEYTSQGLIDFLIIPQDDASPYGLTALDQKLVRAHIKKQSVMSKVYMYPGADEVANTLLSRMINKLEGNTPTVYLRYTSEEGKKVIPLYEDRPLHETVKYQVAAAGGIVIDNDIDADIILIINIPSSKMLNASQAYLKGIEYDAFRNIVEAVEYASYMIKRDKQVVIADVAYGNGSDLELIQLLSEHQLLFKLAGYAAWNTSSNTLGTCIPQGMIYHQYKNTKGHLDFLSLRYTEDAGYCALVRQQTCKEVLPALGLNYFKADGKRGQVSIEVKRLLEEFISVYLKNDMYDIQINDCYMPWSRMFEVGLLTEVKKK